MLIKPNSRIQSVAIDRNKYSKAEAIAWLKRNGFHHDDYDLKSHYRRFRQINPDTLRCAGYTKFRLKQVMEGIKFVLEIRENDPVTK